MNIKYDFCDWFTMVEVEISTACNRKCWYCPNSVTELRKTQNLMQEEIFYKLVSELVRINFHGRISYHLYNEPLLHPRLGELVSLVTEKVPHSRQVLYTNGDYLTDSKHTELTQNGIARFIITSHDSRPIKERYNQVVLFPSMLNLTNRGGTVLKDQTSKIKFPLSEPCYAPHSMLIITHTGDVILCYEDAVRTVNLGNILNNSLEYIWFSDRLNMIRQHLSIGDRTIEQVCSKCSNISHPTPETFDFRL